MRLLICTQAVDRADPALGFFHRWIEEFSKHCESVAVVCLREGAHELPANVRVYTLGKEKGGNRAQYIARFYRLIFSLRREYDAVFVHMNPEYVVLGGVFWRLFGKCVGLWYTHGSVSALLRIASPFADHIFTASKESFRLSHRQVHVMGHGIDTDFFVSGDASKRSDHWLSVGRLMASKQHEAAIEESRASGVRLRIAGEGPERENLEALARRLGADVTFLGPLSQLQLRDEYQRAAKLVHRSTTGSLDKVVLEAAACGCFVDTVDPALRTLPLSPEFVSSHHSLRRLIPRLVGALDGKGSGM